MPEPKRSGSNGSVIVFIGRIRKKLVNMSWVRWLYSDRYLLLHAVEATEAVIVDSDDGLYCNRVEDLALFEQTERWLPRDVFVAEARRRIAEGMCLYTAVTDGRLVHYGWLVPRQHEAWFPYVHQRFVFPEGSSVLFNAYTHPAARGTGLHLRSMRRRIADACASPGTVRVYTAIESHNRASRAVAAKAGFKCVDVLFESVRFGRVNRGRMLPQAYFSRIETQS